jgi:AcrR family transcriptional regulator
VFWEKGYEGTSLSDLTKAMGINRPSLYAAFGNKETLFRKVLDRYNEDTSAYLQKALNAPTARLVAEGLLHSAADVLSDRSNPRGCLLVQGALTCGDSANHIRSELVSRRAQGEAAIRERLKRAKSEGDLPANSDPAVLARFLTTVMQGLSVQVSGGARRKKLQQVIQTALRAWPK